MVWTTTYSLQEQHDDLWRSNDIAATSITNGMSWPVVRMVWTPEISAAVMISSMEVMKVVIMARTIRCVVRERQMSVTLCGVRKELLSWLAKWDSHFGPGVGFSISVVRVSIPRAHPASPQGHKALQDHTEAREFAGSDVPCALVVRSLERAIHRNRARGCKWTKHSLVTTGSDNSCRGRSTSSTPDAREVIRALELPERLSRKRLVLDACRK
jgi:hypothetical protein